MHELSVCQALLDEVARVALAADAKAVRSITVCVGPLSGIEAGLLRRAFDVARCGTVAETAALVVEVASVRIRCMACAAENEVAPNRLLCPCCGEYRTRVIEGDDLVLSSIEMDVSNDHETSPKHDPDMNSAERERTVGR